MNHTAVCWTTRGIISLGWLAIALTLAISGITKQQALFAFVIFRACSVFGLGYVLYEFSLVARKRARAGAIAVDSLLVLPMFIFWFIVRAATF